MNKSYKSIRFAGTLAVLLLIAVGGLLAFKYYAAPLQTEAAQPVKSEPSARPSDSIQAWFTDPSGETGQESLDQVIVRAIDQAQTSVDVAAYNLTLRNVAGALAAAQERGLAVRMVMESSADDNEALQKIKEAGIKIVGDHRPGLMHNKFLVIDGYEVWTGSANLTVSGTSSDNNNLVRVRSEQVALDYTTEFNEMYEQNLFGPDTRAATPYPLVTVGDARVEVYFTPDDAVIERLLTLVQGARTSVDFLAYTFTSDPLSTAILDRGYDGVRVRGVFDFSQNPPQDDTQFDILRRLGLNVQLDSIPGLMHDKVLIIDGQIVELGSYNYTYSADRINDENVLIIHDPALAAQYTEEFERIYKQPVGQWWSDGW